MKMQPTHGIRFSRALCATLALAFTLPQTVQATPPALATAPLVSATTTQVLPNLMFILDNSGSMYQDYTPDYISEYNKSVAGGQNPWTVSNTSGICKDSADDGDSTLDNCVVGDVPYMTSAMNSQYYNPAIRYSPGVNADGSEKASQTNPASVLTDVYNKQNKSQVNASVTTIDLTSKYPDRVWCTTSSPSASDLTDTAKCRKNNDYLYPDATFKYGRSASGVLGVYGAPYYYDVVPTEYCKAADLKECTLTSSATGAYTFPAKMRWCKDAGLTDCQGVYTETAYNKPRYTGTSVSGVAATGKFRAGNSSPRTITSVKVNGVEILGASVTGTSRANLASKIATQINAYASTPEFTAAVCSTDYVCLTSTVAAGATANGPITISGTAGYSNVTDVSGGVTGASVPPYTFARTDIVSTTSSYPKGTSRTDCSGAVGAGGCSYTEEITNFSNWYAYYRTRMQSMKTAVSRAFKPIDSRYRVGFSAINNASGNFLKVDDFLGTQKTNWYAKLFNATNEGSTPLRTALARTGQMFAGKKPTGANDDPVQYSCQQNFALLTTDGYWNTDADSDVKTVTGGSMTNMDGGTTPRPMYEGPTASNASLADVAKHYYETDLRTSALSNCTGAKGIDVCENNVFVTSTDNNVNQHMTTFTLGLGVDGTVNYQSDYKTASSGDYYKLKTGVLDWPKPEAEKQTAVDDLWHAAVNGRGTYFSAKDPSQLATGLAEALSEINAKVGSAAAAATSTLTPVAGDNFVYFPSYTTVAWIGNLEARSVNTTTGVVSKNATWCVEDIIGASCPAPGAIVTVTSGSATTYQCVTPTTVAGDCLSPGVWDGTTCTVDVPVACAGTMKTLVGVSTDTRKIYTSSGSSLVDFKYSNVPAAYFSAATISTGLAQWSELTPAQQSAAAGENLVNYLRGQTGYEDRTSNTYDNRLYRKREATLGDILESKPVHVAEPFFQYSDPGYAKFKEDNMSRGKTIYVGANDGMLHAFNAQDGKERWAFIPSMVLPNMWKLADRNYSSKHIHFVNGVTVVGDICVANCTSDASAQWKTILVGGLGSGGIGYYALDVTNPASPSLLWEFDGSKDSNLGYTYGNPIITKLNDGSWVVMITSGHYNKKDASSPTTPTTGDGKGYLYVLDAKTGTKKITIDTGVGSATDPAGLSAISAWADYPMINNTTTYTYGGDLQGNLWRFDINATTAANRVMKFALLKDASGVVQPITTAPELGAINKKRVVFVATGKYIETSDLTNTQGNTLYAIQDAQGAGFTTSTTTSTLVNPRGLSTMVKQTMTNSGANRTVTTNAVSYSSNQGWYIDFPDSGERANIDPKLVGGALLVPTTVPSNSVCAPGGYGWFNFFDYTSGSYVSGNTTVAEKQNSTIVGINTIYVTKEGGQRTPVIIVGTSDASMTKANATLTPGAGKFQAKRLIWRELIPN